jgi:2-iminobutanoate/2-iminopropanoate deaminase
MIERRSIHVEGLGHGDLPIPAAARVGSLVATGGVRGVDRMTGKMPTDLSEQVRLMFENLLVILQAAGATREGILKLTIWIRNNDARAAINREWLAMFPDEHSRPARHIMLYELGGGMLVQCEALAVAE